MSPICDTYGSRQQKPLEPLKAKINSKQSPQRSHSADSLPKAPQCKSAGRLSKSITRRTESLEQVYDAHNHEGDRTVRNASGSEKEELPDLLPYHTSRGSVRHLYGREPRLKDHCKHRYLSYRGRYWPSTMRQIAKEENQWMT